MPKLPSLQGYGLAQAPVAQPQLAPDPQALGQGLDRDVRFIQAQAEKPNVFHAAAAQLGEVKRAVDFEQSRNDAISRSQDRTAYFEKADALTREYEEKGLHKPEVWEEYQQRMKELGDEAIKNHTGSGYSRDVFGASVGEFTHEYLHSGQLKRREAIQHNFDGEEKRTVARLADGLWKNPSPEGIDEAIKGADAYLSDAGDGMSAQEVEDRRAAMHGQLFTTYVTRALSTGDPKAARAALAAVPPDLFSPEQRAGFETQIGRLEADEMAGIREGQRKIEAAQTILGRPLTAAERAKIAGVYQAPATPAAPEKPEKLDTIDQYDDAGNTWKVPYDQRTGGVGKEIPGTRRKKPPTLEETLGAVLGGGKPSAAQPSAAPVTAPAATKRYKQGPDGKLVPE